MHRLRAESRKNGDPIFVFQMGKVGSTSIVEGLRSSVPDSPIFHFHFLSEHGIRDAKTRLKKIGKSYNANTWCLYESEFVRDYIAAGRVGRKIRIVTLFRDPVARNISSYFYNVRKYLPNFDSYKSGDRASIESLKRSFLDVFPEHSYSQNWFDEELLPAFGVDILKHKSDQQMGYTIIREGRIEILVLKLEKLKECAAEAFSKFLGLSKFRLENANTSDEQTYIDVYQEFKRELDYRRNILMKCIVRRM